MEKFLYVYEYVCVSVRRKITYCFTKTTYIEKKLVNFSFVNVIEV